VLEDPDKYALADWRRQISDVYAKVRATEDHWAAWRAWHETRSDLFRHHPMSPLSESMKQQFRQIPIFPYDPELRFAVELESIPTSMITSDLGGDGTMTYTAFAKTSGLVDKLEGELTVYWIEGYGGGLFIPFGDATNGNETYGGERYIFDAIKGADLGTGADGGLLLDFNFAYNPSCALNNQYVCPLPTITNKLSVAVHAGEQLFPGL
jgi:uncharacterized protein (DUF1684 family)